MVDWAMRYGNARDRGDGWTRFVAQGCERILVVPLYPQYSAATTATVGDEVFRALRACAAAGDPDRGALLRRPGLYRGARLLDQRGARQLDFEPEVILASFHGIPQSYVDNGDPYYGQCVETMRLAARAARARRDRS